MNVMSSSRALVKKGFVGPVRRYLHVHVYQVRLYKHYLVLLKLKKEQTNKTSLKTTSYLGPTRRYVTRRKKRQCFRTTVCIPTNGKILFLIYSSSSSPIQRCIQSRPAQHASRTRKGTEVEPYELPTYPTVYPSPVPLVLNCYFRVREYVRTYYSLLFDK